MNILKIIIIVIIIILNFKFINCVNNNKQDKKLIFAYSLSDDLNGYYNNSNSDGNSIGLIWESIDVLIIPDNLSNIKEIIKIGHEKNVKVALMYSYFNIDSLNIDESINKIMETIKIVGADGCSLYFKFPVDLKYLEKIEKLNKRIKNEINKQDGDRSSHFSVSIPLRIGSYNLNQISLHCDFIIINAYDLGTFEINKIARPNAPGDTVRNVILNNWLNKHNFISNKLILSLSWYGYEFICSTPPPPTDNGNYLFNEDCIIAKDDKYSIINKDYNEIYKFIVGQDLDNNEKYITSMELWNTNSKTPFLNYKSKSNNFYYQIQYDNPKSIYYKLAETGLRGASIWKIDSIYGLPKQETLNMYNSIDRDLFGDYFNENFQLY